MKANADARRTFWAKATVALDAMKKLKPEDRQKIEKSLTARVPKPTPNQLKHQQLQDLRHSLQLAQQRAGNQAGNEKLAQSGMKD